MIDRPTHRVSVKIALFNESKTHILMTMLPNGGFGLPGGHIEGLEIPDEALHRELKEELGLLPEDYINVEQSGFWRENKGDRIILGYSGVLLDSATITVDPTEVIDTKWVTSADLVGGKVFSRNYDEYLRRLFAEVQ